MTRTVVLDLGGVLLSSTAVLADRRCAVLSNAPAGLAATVRAPDWSRAFVGMVFSAEVGLVKPDPAIYAAADAAFGTHDCVFFDDGLANVEAAREHGWEAHVWTGPDDALRTLGGRGPRARATVPGEVR